MQLSHCSYFCDTNFGFSAKSLNCRDETKKRNLGLFLRLESAVSTGKERKATENSILVLDNSTYEYPRFKIKTRSKFQIFWLLS